MPCGALSDFLIEYVIILVSDRGQRCEVIVWGGQIFEINLLRRPNRRKKPLFFQVQTFDRQCMMSENQTENVFYLIDAISQR